jgi:branched-chain amino acid transport system substrate-binding protein
MVVITMALVTGSIGGAGASTKKAAPSGTPLVIGWVGTQSGASVGGTSTVVNDTLDAWTKWTNANGGINGHPVKIVYEKDDKGDPAVAITAVKDLTEKQKVLAIVGDTSVPEPSWAAYAAEQKIPVIGPNNVDTLPLSNPMFYAVGGSFLTNIWGMMKSASVQGVKKVGVLLCTESPQCEPARAIFKSLASQVGMTETYDAVASGTQPSYTAECLAAKEPGTQALAAFIAPAGVTVLIRDCARQGFSPKWIMAEGAPSVQSIKSSPSLGKTVGSSEQWTCQGAPTPGTQDFYTAMKKYHPEYNKGTSKWEQFGPGNCKAWVAGMAFKKAIENAAVASTATATRADVIKGLSMFKNETLGGYAPDLTYSDGNTPNPELKCTYLYKWSGTNFLRVPKDGSPTCKPA